jgi:hypothetical protein
VINLWITHSSRQRREVDDQGRAEQLLRELYGPDHIDPARLRFYHLLDPLTWS